MCPDLTKYIYLIMVMIIIIMIYSFKAGMIKIVNKLIKANHLTKMKLNSPYLHVFKKILNYLHRSCTIYSCNR